MSLDIVLVGAGSREFGPATLRDIYLSDALGDADVRVVLMDLVGDGLERNRAYAHALGERLGRRHRVDTTTDLDRALDGADYVVVAVEVDRYHYWAQDFHLPRSYGFRQIYGENGGPGGLFHALRNMRPSVDIARAMERACPHAWLLNYTNPLTRLCEAQVRLTSTKVVGLCHGFVHGREQVCRLLGHPEEDLEAYACGLNHITWFQEIRSRSTGEDLYPRLRAREREAHWLSDWDDIALQRTLMRTFGLYPSPGANHTGEYIRWAEEFLASDKLQFFYDPREGHPWEGGRVPTWIYNLQDAPTESKLFWDEHPARIRPPREDREGQTAERILPSGELAVPLIEGLSLGVRHDLPAVNVRNRGWVPNLPGGAVVEVPAVVDADGLHPREMAPLPEAVAAILRTQVSISVLLVEAFVEGSKDKLLQALLLDPTCHSHRQAIELVNRMCALQAEQLPALAWEGAADRA
jgi:alpha-galactosidase